MSPGSTDAPMVLTGEARLAGPNQVAAACRVVLAASDLTIQREGAAPIVAAYRDVTTIALDRGIAVIVVGGEVTLLLERFGTGLGALARIVRENRARQRLDDRLVTLPNEPLALLETDIGGVRGVAQLAIHPWGLILLPIDERQPWIDIRRVDIGEVALDESTGTVRVSSTDGSIRVALPALGGGAGSLAHRISALRDGAALDAAANVGTLMPDAPFGARQKASALLVDGRPVDRDGLGDAWPIVEAAFLVDPTFMASYRALQARSGGSSAPSWLAMAPVEPGAREVKTWTFVGLPGNLVALELLSEGAHATYLFRIVPRAAYRGEPPGALVPAASGAVRAISNTLVDIRFLREPIALPESALQLGGYRDYRVAVASLPTLQAARRGFVARLVHASEAGWAAALDDCIAWHGACRDDAAEWPGRAGQEALVSDTAIDNQLPTGSP